MELSKADEETAVAVLSLLVASKVEAVCFEVEHLVEAVQAWVEALQATLWVEAAVYGH